ncbi:MAG: hypothetical protein QOF81_798 [Acidimicrobiaceae bacterium]|nr:hypothetical protein [Acidimicrobiaceae bacterium]
MILGTPETARPEVVNRLIAHEPRLESHKSSITISAPTSTPVLGGPCSLDGNGFDPRPADDRQIRAQPNARAVNGPPPAPPPTGTRATNPAPSTPATPPRTAAPPRHPLGVPTPHQARTWGLPYERHRPRRGRSPIGRASPRSIRRRANDHRASTPPQAGHPTTSGITGRTPSCSG